MGRLMLQEGAKVLADTAVVTLEEELVFLYKEVATGLGLVSLAVATDRAPTVVQVGTLPLEHSELRGQHSDKFVVNVKSQRLIPNAQ